MKKTILILFLTYFSIITYAQPPAFSGLDESSNSNASVFGTMQINGIDSEDGDWIAAFDEQDNLVGASEIIMGFFVMTLYGGSDQLMAGEMFKLRGWDASTNTYYQKGEPEEEFGPWSPQTGGGWLPGFGPGDTPNFVINFDNILPIELSAFGVQKRSCDQFNLEWTTATEINNEYFSIQRSIDNVYSFETIDRVEGAGNSNSDKTYTYNDEIRLTGEHTVYYRLKQTDFDGRSSFSNIIFATYNCRESNNLQVYPNPFENEINVKIEIENTTQVTVLDSHGRLVYDNQFVTEDELLRIATTDWPEGLYIIRTVQEGNLFSFQKIIKQN